MSETLHTRLNKVLDRLLEEDFLSGRGLGNEIAFYIFDYPPERELEVRDRIQVILRDIGKRRPDLRVSHVNLFDLVIDHLIERGLLDKSIEMQAKKGNTALRSALSAPLQAGKLAKVFERVVDPRSRDLVLLSGVGSVYPMLRSHSLLNNLHAVMAGKPLVMFFPGSFDGQSLRLFNKLHDENYYRAFRLSP